jgi:hypothetical protein
VAMRIATNVVGSGASPKSVWTLADYAGAHASLAPSPGPRRYPLRQITTVAGTL